MSSSRHFSIHDTLPDDIILPNKSKPFSIVWADNTDSICDLPSLLINGSATPSSLPSSSPLPHHPLPPSNAPAPTEGILAGIHSRPGDLVDLLTMSGSLDFLSDLFDTESLFEIRDFRITRAIPKGETIEQFAASMHLVLDLADKYPRDSLRYTHFRLRCVVPPSVVLSLYSPWQSKAYHLQRQTFSAWRLESFVGNRPVFCTVRN